MSPCLKGRSSRTGCIWIFGPGDQAAEVARLEALGARRVDIGQGEVSWVVMADPDGNEFDLGNGRFLICGGSWPIVTRATISTPGEIR